MNFIWDKIIDGLFIFAGVYFAFHFNQCQQNRSLKNELDFNIAEMMKSLPKDEPLQIIEPFKITSKKEEKGCSYQIDVDFETSTNGGDYLKSIKDRGLVRFFDNKGLVSIMTVYFGDLVPDYKEKKNLFYKAYQDIVINFFNQNDNYIPCFSESKIRQVEQSLKKAYMDAKIQDGVAQQVGVYLRSELEKLGYKTSKSKGYQLFYRFKLAESPEDFKLIEARKKAKEYERIGSRQSDFKNQDYLEDFEALKSHLSSSYANLEFILKHYRLNAYELSQKTIKALKLAKTKLEAETALQTFVSAFKDGHFRLTEVKKEVRPSESEEVTTKISSEMSGEKVCEALGFTRDKKFDFRFSTEKVLLADQGGKEFPYLVVETDNKKLGFIRIADFRETVYPNICLAAWASYKKTVKKNCDTNCQDDFQYNYMRKALVDKFYDSLAALHKANIKTLIVDLTFNGGGSDWVTDITALLSDRDLVCGRSGFVKHPHHLNNFKQLLSDLEASRPQDEEKIVKMKTNIKKASESCDRSALWNSKNSKLDCSLVAYREDETCKYKDLNYPNKQKFKGQLILLVNRHTASAAEDLVARHLDSKTALVVGERTHGAGCGYMNGGIRFKLPKSGLDVRIPDCVREMIDGTNEVAGIRPNIEIDMSKIEEPNFLNDLVGRIVNL